jgi:CheY-specific phosphatase CheX
MLMTQTPTPAVKAQPLAPNASYQVPSVLVEQTIKSTIDSFAKFCGEISPVEADRNDLAQGMKIDGIISFVGDLTWSMILVLPIGAAEMMALKFAGFEIPYDSEDMGDVVGELTNVLAGVLCGNLEAVGVKSQMSLPTITRGSDFEQLMSDSLISEKLYFVTGGTHFMIKLIVAKHK